MLAGMAQQVQHENDLIARRKTEDVVVRLVPQIPLRDGENPRSWLGGNPRLPSAMQWPEFEGKPCQFLAQICCEDLPADLWEGLGPRQGWLAFFIHPEAYKMQVFHLHDQGESRNCPDIEGAIWFNAAQSLKKKDEGPGPVLAFPMWPVDVQSVTQGKTDPRLEGRPEILHEHYVAGYDVADPAQQPFDWSTTKLMLNMALASITKHFANYDPTTAQTIIAERVANQQKALAEAVNTGATPERLAEIRITLLEYSEGSKGSAQNYVTAQTAIPRLKVMIEEIEALSLRKLFSPELIAPFLAELKAMPWVFKSVAPYYRDGQKLTPEQREKEGVQLHRKTISSHFPGRSLWTNDFETFRFDWAKHAYCQNPQTLAPPIRDFYEATWRNIAAHEMAGMGHVPFRYVHEFESSEEITLLELPSSQMMSWMFGDVDNLVVTMKKADLAVGNFAVLEVQVSN